MDKKLSSLTIFLFLIVALIGCSGGAKKESVLDTPQAHYEIGKSHLANNDYDSALREFERAKALDKKYAPAYEGLALTYLGMGDTDKAEKNTYRGFQLDDDFAPMYIAQGRIEHSKGKYDKAVDNYKRALKKDKDNTEALNAMGLSYTHDGKYDKAEEAYTDVLALDPNNMVADEGLKKLSEFTRATAGMPSEYIEIAKKESITRAELAALYVNELPLNKIFKKAPKTEQAKFQTPGEMANVDKSTESRRIADLPDSHWAKSFVELVVEKGLMDIGPDNSFRPEEIVNKLAFSQVVERFLERAFNDSSLPTRYIGTTSPFADVDGSHYAFNAVMTASSRGIIEGKMDGSFGVNDPVSGTAALLILKKLKDQLEIKID